MKTKNAEPLIVPVRVALPVGTLFKFDGLRTRYEVVAAPTYCFACRLCALRRPKKRVYCESFFCAPGKRDDDQFVYVRVARPQKESVNA